MMGTGTRYNPKILGFLCNWCCYAGADLCGVSRYQYPPHIRIVRLMCSGRMDMEFVFRAFQRGLDGVFIGGCWPGECHYITEGNYIAISTIHICKRLLALIGINPSRLRLEWVSASEGVRFAEVMTDFSGEVEELGPFYKGDDPDISGLESILNEVMNLIPYIKLVERERLRVSVYSVDEYEKFLNSDDFDRLFRELIEDKLVLCRIMALLRENPASSDEISGTLNLNPSELSQHIINLSRQGLIGYNKGQNSFFPATGNGYGGS